LRLGHWFGTGPELWITLQANHDLAVAARDIGSTVAQLPKRRPEAA
jgi:plasmid maintenance system antidote protein VapI